jgi:hypothetical protein
MNDYWNDPPEDYEPPECCNEPMDIKTTGVLSCAKCGKRIEPKQDPIPDPEIELPENYLKEK